jgi:hypothetical protein
MIAVYRMSTSVSTFSIEMIFFGIARNERARRTRITRLQFAMVVGFTHRRSRSSARAHLRWC